MGMERAATGGKDEVWSGLPASLRAERHRSGLGAAGSPPSPECDCLARSRAVRPARRGGARPESRAVLRGRGRCGSTATGVEPPIPSKRPDGREAGATTRPGPSRSSCPGRGRATSPPSRGSAAGRPPSTWTCRGAHWPGPAGRRCRSCCSPWCRCWCCSARCRPTELGHVLAGRAFGLRADTVILTPSAAWRWSARAARRRASSWWRRRCEGKKLREILPKLRGKDADLMMRWTDKAGIAEGLICARLPPAPADEGPRRPLPRGGTEQGPRDRDARLAGASQSPGVLAAVSSRCPSRPTRRGGGGPVRRPGSQEWSGGQEAGPVRRPGTKEARKGARGLEPRGS